ncbi:DNA-processing protein DprA [Fimbriiglobus ruber]|uniref:Rossmann fold nucleotide-binding protein Smf n=1 Tax=Fimbriiglobus ruber TaxID=1908690 RepID=A0A225DPT0_9BACT|nr:DNA-processing protein DprA [Fimbriiglobus ruber]OWK43311.1 Rossmann fold nucleotide-binding protein Smf [Fimbriiglobus ruber]
MPAPPVPPDLRDHLALALVPGLGPKLTRAVLEHFGSAAAALAATAPQLETIPLVGAKLAARFAASFRNVDITPEWDLIDAHAVRVVRAGEPEYPARLAAIDDAPPLLYLRGALTAADANAVGIVGSRACTSYGKRVAERIAAGLAAAGWTVVSGLARGIDGAAHRGALDAGGRTIAVLAGGLSKIYPPEHADLAEEVAARGALVTETPMTVAPQPGMFPARNRIISGLCRGIVVIEANAKSGALITATHAAEQGREVFAVPGNVDSAPSAGCLDLIRKGARLVRTADDVLDDLRGIAPLDPGKPAHRPAPAPAPTLFDAPSPGPPAPPPGLDPQQQKVWDALATPRHVDELSREIGVPVGELVVVLMKMEMRKVVRRLPGNQYERRV